MFFILSLSTLPGDSLPKSWLLSFDKLIHLIEYFILGLLLMKSMKNISTKMLIIVIPFGIIFGIMDEYLQSFISGRFSSGWDVLADTIGVIIGSLLVIGNHKK
jgi:VanZ family protein